MALVSGFSNYVPRDFTRVDTSIPPPNLLENIVANTLQQLYGPVLARPVIIPDKYSGDTNFGTWLSYFEDCSQINGWLPYQKILISKD